jgi:hypothetical protein
VKCAKAELDFLISLLPVKGLERIKKGGFK